MCHFSTVWRLTSLLMICLSKWVASFQHYIREVLLICRSRDNAPKVERNQGQRQKLPPSWTWAHEHNWQLKISLNPYSNVTWIAVLHFQRPPLNSKHQNSKIPMEMWNCFVIQALLWGLAAVVDPSRYMALAFIWLVPKCWSCFHGGSFSCFSKF